MNRVVFHERNTRHDFMLGLGFFNDLYDLKSLTHEEMLILFQAIELINRHIKCFKLNLILTKFIYITISTFF